MAIVYTLSEHFQIAQLISSYSIDNRGIAHVRLRNPTLLVAICPEACWYWLSDHYIGMSGFHFLLEGVRNGLSPPKTPRPVACDGGKGDEKVAGIGHQLGCSWLLVYTIPFPRNVYSAHHLWSTWLVWARQKNMKAILLLPFR